MLNNVTAMFLNVKLQIFNIPSSTVHNIIQKFPRVWRHLCAQETWSKINSECAYSSVPKVAPHQKQQ